MTIKAVNPVLKYLLFHLNFICKPSLHIVYIHHTLKTFMKQVINYKIILNMVLKSSG